MNYIDTGVLIAYAIESDPNHDKASKILESLEGERIVSDVTVFELVRFFSKHAEEIELDLQVSREVKILFLVEYTLRLAGVKVMNLKPKVRAFRMVDESIRMLEPFSEASRISLRLNLSPLALLHLATAKRLGARKFVTFRKEIIARKPEVESLFGFEVIG